MREKLIIGRKDLANFPELELENIAVKIDTGAFTSSIHCDKIEEIEHEGESAIRFQLLDPTHEWYNGKTFVFKKYKLKKIKSSSGHSELRYIIRTKIELFRKIYPVELSLSERGDMKYPVLLGRKLLRKRFLIDPSKQNLSYNDLNNE
ncbi:MAG: ATP-dependent zinc protease [Prolixibacteraceae bacterium]|nr:ATP-dependent zinc protease [Prolixibacteraceae bacterium]